MSSVRFVFPKVRLAEILKAPGGVTVADALERAEFNLELIKPTCLAEMVALIELAETRFEQLGDTFDDEALEALYAVAVKGIGGGAVCGAPTIDSALTSMCDLLDSLRNNQRFDRDAIGVHIRAWRLLMNVDLPEAGAAAVLDGLLKVSRRYAG